MKKLLSITALTVFIACSESNKNETITDIKDSASSSTSNPSSTTNQPGNNSNAVTDSTKMLDKMLADSTVNMSPDSLK